MHDGEHNRQRCSAVRLGSSLAGASLDSRCDHPAIWEHKTTAGLWRQSTFWSEQMAYQPIGYIVQSGQMRSRIGFDLLCCRTGLDHIRCAFVTE